MIVLLAILSLGLLGLIIYFIISPKSSRLIKLVATIALGLIGLSLLICGIFVIVGPRPDPNAVFVPFLSEEEEQQAVRSVNILDIVIFSVLFGIISLIVLKSIREQKKMNKVKKESKPKKRQSFEEEGELDKQQSEDSSFLDDDSFNLEGFD